MSSILMCISPTESHVGPILEVARAFVAARHRVRVLTGARFAERIQAIGAQPLALPPEGDIIDQLDLSGRARGRRALNDGLMDVFIRPATAQLPALQDAMREDVDAIVADPSFFAVSLLRARPVLAMCGIFPLSVSSVDTAPFGMGMAPPRNAAQRMRSRMMSWMARRVILAPLHRDLDAFLQEQQLDRLGDLFFTDYIFRPGAVDLYAQFTVPAFEYPRRDLPACVRFYGPLLPPSRSADPLPDWWEQLDDDRPIVHVSQGTVGNTDFTELVAPTLEALTDESVTVVVAAGRADKRAIGDLPPLPANAFAADFLPYRELMPRLSAFVTNGGYGGLHFALAAGVPIVVAGDKEDKLETSARVAWSGTGVNLRTGRPAPDAIRAAVRAVLEDPTYRDRAAQIARDIAASPGAAGLVADVEKLIADRQGATPTTLPLGAD